MSVLKFPYPVMHLSTEKAVKHAWKNSYADVFIPGFLGWGEGSFLNHLYPYWGTIGGDAMKYLRSVGFHCVGARVHPTASNWDRACELYAHLTGTRTDYGYHHSLKYGHARFGRDFTGRALLPAFDEEHKINLIGYSLGGTTALLFLDLLANGSEEEMATTPAEEISPLFTGGKADYVHSLVALATPINGTTAMEVLDVMTKNKPERFWDWAGKTVGGILCKPIKDGRDARDSAGYDMRVDTSAQVNKKMHLPDSVYYFSMPFSATDQVADGTWKPRKGTEPLFSVTADYMCKYQGITENGYVIDEAWLENDGLVNRISALAPFGAKKTKFDRDCVEPGVWNVMPVLKTGHLFMMGDMFLHKNIRPYCVGLLQTLHEIV